MKHNVIILVLLGFYLTSAAMVEDEAPEIFEVTFHTDVSESGGIISLQVNRSWAPLGADHFYKVASSGFYNGAAFFRYVPNFVVQFGISGTPRENKKWSTPIKDDPVTQKNLQGTVVYATAGPNTRTTQLFINFVDNTFLDADGFAPIGKITSEKSLAVAKDIFNPTPGNSNGVNQTAYTLYGNAWLKKHYTTINYILNTSVRAV